MMQFQPTTINRIIADAIERHRQKEDWLNYKAEGRWRPVSAVEFARRIQNVAMGLYDLGIRPGDQLAILSENRLEWTLADIGTMALGAVDVPIYATQAPSQVKYILRDSGARLLFISSPSQLARVSQAIDQAPELEWIVAFDPISDRHENLLPFSEIEARGARLTEREPQLYEQLWKAVKPGDLATLIYTSGTTGQPKGVMLSHWNIASNIRAVCSILGYSLDDVVLSILPFSHVFERTAFYMYLHHGVRVYYAEGIDRVPQNLREVRPTIVVGVPRLFEKVYERLVTLAQQSSPWRRRFLIWAVSVGKRYGEKKAQQKPIDPFLKLQYRAAYRLVLLKWRTRLGLDRLRFFVSGGAPLSTELEYIFSSAGIEIMQGYGLSETSPGITVNSPQANKLGTVGKVLPGVEVRIADDGEILVRGPNVMLGYFHLEEENRQVFTEDGWLKTGDVGYLDEEGYLVITDRKKDLIKTSGGKYIAPQAIESRIKLSPFVSEVVVVGNRRKFASALIVPNLEAVKAYARQQQITDRQAGRLCQDERIIALFQQQVDELTADLSRYEKVKKIAILDEPFSVDGGEFTPTMKIRRRQVEEKYQDVIDRLYAEAETSAAGHRRPIDGELAAGGSRPATHSGP